MTSIYNIPALHAFMCQHAHKVHEILGFCPTTVHKIEQFGPFTKYTLCELPSGDWAMFHHVTAIDDGPPHCHPCQMKTHLFNPYLERVYQGGEVEEALHPAGSTYEIAPERIHCLAGLPDGECWSLCFASPVAQKWRHYPELV